METLVLTGDNKSEMRLIAGIAKKFGLKTRKLSDSEIEDIGLSMAMKEGETGEFIDTEQFLQSIRKK